MDSGLLYVIFNKWITDPETDIMPYKIGITRNSVEDRYYGLGLKMPGKFETLFAYKIKDCAKVEQIIHSIFNKHCVNGEWFTLNQKEIDLIKANCEMMDGILVTQEVEKEIETETQKEFFENALMENKTKNILTQNIFEIEDNSINKISKKEAISILNKRLSLGLNNSNTIYSNINKSRSIWWFELDNSRFNNSFNLIFNDHNNKILYHFFIKSGSIKKPETLFYQRNDKHRQNVSSIVI
jgi:galactitol-specific phosphotransferase system IIB component